MPRFHQQIHDNILVILSWIFICINKKMKNLIEKFTLFINIKSN